MLVRESNKGILILRKTENMKLEQGSWSSPPNGAFTSSSDGSSVKEVSSFPSENTSESRFKTHNTDPNGGENCEKKDIIFNDESNGADTYSFSDDLGDITQTSDEIDFFENSKEKVPGDFLYDGWPEIGSFADVERMFRSSDSTFGLGANTEVELNWLSSAYDTEGTGDMPKSDFSFPLPESYTGKDLVQNDDPKETYYVDDPSITCAPILLKDSSWPKDTYDCSLAKRPVMTESKDELIPEEETNEHRKRSKNQNQSDGNRKRRYYGNANFNCLDNNSFPDQTTVNRMPSSTIFQTKGLLKLPPAESFHASSQLQSLEDFHHSYLVFAEGNKKLENLQNHQGSQQSLNQNHGNTRVTLQPSTCTSDSVGKLPFSGSEFESHRGIDSINSVIPAELGFSNVLENSTKNSCLDAISLEAASFLQLQLVMEQLDLRTKLCIRDSLYRLARSAERRHSHANRNDTCGDEREASGAFVADRINKHTGSMGMETDTNPIDRSIAHLLFHRPSETYAVPANDSSPFRSPRMVHGAITTTIMVDNLVCTEENSAAIDKGGSNR